MKWIDDVGNAWRFYSVQIQLIGAVLMAAWLALDPSQQQALIGLATGQEVSMPGAALALFLFIGGIFGRLKKQDLPKPAEPEVPLPKISEENLPAQRGNPDYIN